MSDDTYFVIRATEDGEVYIDCYTKAQLEAALNGHDYGDPTANVLSVIDNKVDLATSHGILIIRGKVVTPIADQWSVE